MGDDEETPGNVKLLAKYNLMVGLHEYYDDSNFMNAEKCENDSGVWNDDKERCDFEIQYSSSTAGYNLQFSEDKGNDCTMRVYIYYYTNLSKSDCEAMSGGYYLEDEQTCGLMYYSGVNQSECEGNDFYYDNGLCYPGNDIQNYITSNNPSKSFTAGEICYSKKLVKFTDSLLNNGTDYTYYWQDLSSRELLSNYSLINNQTAPYVYYDNNKNIDSNNIIAPYVNYYKNYLESEFNLTITDARLMSTEEFTALCPWDPDFRIDEDDVGAYTCQGSNYWIFNTTYWLGTATNNLSNVYYVEADNGRLTSDRPWERNGGIRPVISVSKSIFN